VQLLVKHYRLLSSYLSLGNGRKYQDVLALIICSKFTERNVKSEECQICSCNLFCIQFYVSFSFLKESNPGNKKRPKQGN
jgi:hypothetical protein